MEAVPKHLVARLLYTNPVCFLSTATETGRNVMTISWLTALSNHGAFLCSMNERRHSAELVEAAHRFVLSVAVETQQELLLAVGGSSGRDGDKIERIPVPICPVGAVEAAGVAAGADFGVAGAAAHLLCVERVDETRIIDHHRVMVCDIVEGFVRPEYWASGKTLEPSGPDVARTLTFFGTKRFGVVEPCARGDSQELS